MSDFPSAEWKPPERMVSHVFTVDGYALINEHDALGDLVPRLTAEYERLHRLLPDPPQGQEWYGEVETSDDLMNDSIRARVIFRLRKR